MRNPGGVLGEIVARKRQDVAARLEDVTLPDLLARAERSTRSLRAALARPGARFIMEVKRASPSGGALRADLDPAALARAYAPAADAISVLTDTPYFGGSLDDLAAVRAAYDGPILAKDFVVDARQIAEARIHGADAILVMLSVLDDEDARGMITTAASLGMETLVEAHDEEEARRAVALGAPIIGINNRDLKSLKVDLTTTEQLAALVPQDRLLVSESGIAARADVERLAPLVDAFLIGSSLVKADDPGLAARALAYGPVKICGLTRPEDAALAAASGASYGGIIMVPGTPRAVRGDAAIAVASCIQNKGMKTVAIFWNEPLEAVADAARSLALDAVQLHGDEDEAYLASLRALLAPPVEIWTAGPAGASRPRGDRRLFDTGKGGTGMTFDWSLLQGRDDLGSAFLAGGLNPANAAAARRVGAYGLDVSSGVEASPGVKDAALVCAFFEALRPATRGEATC